MPADLALYDDLPAKYTKKVQLTSNDTGGQTTRPQGEVLRERYAEINATDRAIGTLRKHLAAQGLRENTLVFYCGDNGTSGDAALGVPHRGVKGQVYEGGTLVPGLIEWPAPIPKPRTTSFRASTSDLLPKLAALVGRPLPTRPLDGVDLTPVLADADYRGPRAIIEGRFKLVIHEQKRGEPRRELFDLEADPPETNDLAARQPAVAHKLQTNLRAWQDSVLRSLTGADCAK